jgi:hypothetical protein
MHGETLMYRLLMTVVAADGIVFGFANLLLPDLVLSILGGEANALFVARRPRSAIIVG